MQGRRPSGRTIPWEQRGVQSKELARVRRSCTRFPLHPSSERFQRILRIERLATRLERRPRSWAV
jgi:hypothetical protein